MKNESWDAIVIGSGPNGLAAAVRLAMEGLSVKVFEAGKTIGGGTRTLELTAPGFQHDVCSAIHPMAAASPFFQALPLESHGLEWIHPDIPLAHPMDSAPAVLQHRDISRMEAELGADYEAYRRMFLSLSESWEELAPSILAPFRIPDRPFQMARFGLQAIQSAERLVNRNFTGERAKALFAGLAAHSLMPLEKTLSSAIGIVMGSAAHSVGWPMAKGGSGRITQSLAGYLEELGGEIETGTRIQNLDMLPPARTLLFDLTPRQILQIAGSHLPRSYRKKLETYRYGPGVFKLDYLLSEPVPWSDPECARAGTVHVGGTFEEIAASERSMSQNRHSEKPYVLVAQQSLFDSSRTPDERQTLWAYCHVPSGSDRDMTKEIEMQIERFAPGFRDVIEQKVSMTADDFETYNANYIGGDINGGAMDIRQLFTRPAGLIQPYALPVQGLYICSASTPPGGGVHGMCGFHAAELVLKREFDFKSTDFQFHL